MNENCNWSIKYSPPNRNKVYNLVVYYRISDKGNQKKKLPHADKFTCLLNAIKEFGAENLFVIADNCQQTTVDFLRKRQLDFVETSLGVQGVFMYMMEKILGCQKDPNDVIYFLEDDFLHLPGSKSILFEGLEISDYVTLYDHPDKYWYEADQGNFFNYKKLQKTRLYITKSVHWREINSTVMTFACRIKTLEDDYKIWRTYCVTKKRSDFLTFVRITQNFYSKIVLCIILLISGRYNWFNIIIYNMLLFGNKGTKKLISSVPAYATHTELATIAPVRNWDDIT
jgi:hypothetical protein